MWMPERVWEQSMTSDLVAAGIQYTMLDDFHFKNAGLSEDQLHGYYLTEDDGNLLAVFPGSEPLRYLIPFASPQETIDYLGRLAAEHPGAVAVFGDDGEKFGAWPETKKHVYDDGWLVRFFDLLVANQSWIKSVTPSEVLDSTPPVGKIYLPEGSYREMTEWVLAGRAVGRIRGRAPRDGTRPALAADRAVRARRFLAELQGQVSRSQRDVRPHDDGQPPAASGGRRRHAGRAGRAGPHGPLSRPVQLRLLARGLSAASICRTCATPSITS